MILARTDMKELPKSCMECDLRQMADCAVDERIDIHPVMFDGRPDNCSLIETMEKREVSE